ncbi:MAG: inositol monophosphatase family protein [Alphaproteobacteria bacterium]|nr:inositol monophosphatase family protein [Alphaproteobacteria bacterium]
MPIRSALMNVMFKAAEKAAKGLVHDFGEVENLQVSRKGPGDFVSTADLNAQRILREELGKARPSFGFLMEEQDGEPDSSGKEERWIVDPLDGTSNFLHGLGHWSISIAAERAGELIAGLVFDPIKAETFWAEKGTGAYGANRRLRVSGRKDFSSCLIATGIPFKGTLERKKNFLPQMAAVMPKVAGIRRFGSAALDLAYVAAGRYDGFWEEALYPWDCAAGVLLVKEAGGFVAPIQPKEDFMKTGSLIASNAEIHKPLVTLIREASSAA